MGDDVEATSVGSIIGYLRLDDSDYNDKLDAAQARADKLEADHPNIKVTADTAEADAALAETTAETDALNASTTRLKVSTKDLNAAQGDSNKGGGAGYYGLIAGVLGTILPMLGPIAAGAIADGAAFIGMGASGVLAYEGIQKQMAAGTAEGQQYSDGVKTIKSVLDSLEGTAANSVLGAFNTAVEETHQHLPLLNTDVNMLSVGLGKAGGSVLQAFLNGLAVMTPLVNEADQGIEKIASDFDSFSSGSGLVQFVNYATTELPIVESNFASLGKGVVDFVGDLTPLGNVMLDILGDAGSFLNFLSGMGPVLPVIAGGALAAYAAWKLWNGIPTVLNAVQGGLTSIRDAGNALIPITDEEIAQSALLTEALSTEAGVLDAVNASEDAAAVGAGALAAATDILEGPVGIVIALLGAVAVGAITAASATQSNAAAMTDYTEAVEQDNGAIGENVKVAAAKALADAGAYTAASKLGISYQTLTEATLGNAAAQKQVNAVLDELAAKNKDAYLNGSFVATQSSMNGSAAAFAKTLNTVRDGMDGNNKSIEKTVTLHQQEQEALENTSAATYDVTVQQDTAATAIAWTTTQLTNQTNAATLLNNVFTLLDGGTLGVATAQTAVASASNAVIASLKQNGTQVIGSTAAAIANQQAIQAQVQAAQQYAEAVTKSTGSTKDGIAAYEGSETAMLNTLKAQGKLTPAVKAYITQLYGVPALVNTVVKADTSQATAAIVALEKEWAKYPSYMQTAVGPNLSAVNPDPSKYIFNTGGSAHGGSIGYLASGGNAGSIVGPGSGTSDSILRYLSNGEYVSTAQAAATPGVKPLLNSLNQNPSATMGAIATRGTQQAPPVHVHVHIEGKGVALEDLMELHIQQHGMWQQIHTAAGGAA